MREDCINLSISRFSILAISLFVVGDCGDTVCCGGDVISWYADILVLVAVTMVVVLAVAGCGCAEGIMTVIVSGGLSVPLSPTLDLLFLLLYT